MGDHYVPRYYLKGFSLEGKRIWAFDKEEKRAFATQVKSIANETGFYSSTVEQDLANQIEGPANQVLRAIRSRLAISQSDKRVLSAYMVCMLKRVPHTKEWARELAPGMLEQIVEDVSRKLDVLERESRSGKSFGNDGESSWRTCPRGTSRTLPTARGSNKSCPIRARRSSPCWAA
jgi:hypothetical protein